ncbi:MAG: aminotransferase class V-fold PLP-dependent enzyme [Betaproteobacteria bacterium]|nr:aminotransferase class V-fold PLP-dependent enzyme [Betaproteobacteria bacterium]
MSAFGWPLRRRFLLEPGTAFLNHGSFGTTPRRVLAAARRWQRRMEANPDRFVREILPGALRDAAARLAGFLSCSERDLVFVENATSGANAVLRSLELRPGDEILATTHGYNAVRQAMRYVCSRTGAKLVEARIDLPVKNESDLIASIQNNIGKRTRLLVLDHVSSPTGLIFPVKRLAALARRRGVQVLIDGAHAPGQLDLDIASLGVDWYTGNCHKWLFAPKGCGFLWARKSAQRGLHPLAISHGYGKGLAAEFDWTGTRDFSAWLAITAALDFYSRLNPQRLRAHNHRLAIESATAISRAWGMPLDGPPELHGSMMAVRLPDSLQRSDPARLMSRYLTLRRTVVAVMQIGGARWLRLSAQAYNSPGDYAALLRTLPEK